MTAARLLFVIGLAGATEPAGGAWAASSEWYEAQGARIRIVTSDAPDPRGVIRGALDIELKPGWKTYWRDPGDAGVPPTIDVSRSVNVSAAELDFPAPERHDDGDYTWAGYSAPVVLPVTFALAKAGQAADIEADVFLGVCQDICVPVQTAFSIDTSRPSGDPEEQAIVAAAFAGLPEAARDDFRVLTPTIEGDQARFEVVVPEGAKPVDFFLAAAEGYAFATPALGEKDGKSYFTLDATRPDTKPTEGALHYTLVTDRGAVSGTLPYF